MDEKSLATDFAEILLEKQDIEETINAIIKKNNIPRRIAEAIACESNQVPERYTRNIGTVGHKGQSLLLRSKVLVAGLGGLGGYVAEQLARSGVGIIVGVDPDNFEANNLNRQLFATNNVLGKAKTTIARERLASVNEAIEFRGYINKWEDIPANAFDECCLIFDCLDNAQGRLILEKHAEQKQIILIHGAIGGWYGQVAVLKPGSNVLQRIYENNQQGIEQEMGNPAFTPAIAASMMVAEGIKIILGKREPDNILTCFDLLQNKWQQVEF